jgi:hypothetical protein
MSARVEFSSKYTCRCGKYRCKWRVVSMTWWAREHRDRCHFRHPHKAYIIRPLHNQWWPPLRTKRQISKWISRTPDTLRPSPSWRGKYTNQCNKWTWQISRTSTGRCRRTTVSLVSTKYTSHSQEPQWLNLWHLKILRLRCLDCK